MSKTEKKTEEKKENSSLRGIAIIILLALCLELFFCNFRTYVTMFYRETEYPLEQLALEDCEWTPEGYLHLTGEEGGRIYVKGLDGLLGNAKFHGLCLEIAQPQKEDVPYEESGIVRIGLHLRDEAHDHYADLAEHIYREDVEKSRYIYVDAAGVVKTLVLDLKPSEGEYLLLEGITVNPRQPLFFSFPRFCVILILLFGAYLLRKDSFVWQEDAVGINAKKLILIVASGAILLFPAVYLNLQNDYLKLPRYFQPYQRQAEAFAAGQAALLEEPPAELARMANPYDYTAREAAGLLADADYLWDTAYYKGKYHTYFGIVPCILFYLPCYLISGTHLSDGALMLFCGMLVYAGLYLLLREWLRRHEAGLPFGYLWLGVILGFLGSGMVTNLSAPDPHDIPRAVGLAFVLWGLYLWQRSIRKDKKGLHYGLLAAGSLCMALAVGCRANQALWSFLALSLFWDYRKCEKEYDQKARGLGILALLLPYVPVAIGLMYFNAIRFGSVFDFGYDYNLTVLDYTQKNVFLDRILVGIYEFLFRAPRISYVFPFLESGDFVQENAFGHGSFYYTLNYGGLLCCNLVLLALPGLFRGKKKDGGKWLLGFGLLEMLVNICVAGVAYHYRVDFAVFLILAALIGALRIRVELLGTGKESWLKGFLVLALVTALFYYSCFYYISSVNMGNTELYYRMYYAWRF